jgi:RNA polymerase subunit RPABC4/transcription elongation factor Spt4
MTRKTSGSPYKYVFAGILILAGLGLAFMLVALLTFMGLEPYAGHARIMALLPFVLLGSVYVAAVAVLVYKDATRRGLDPWLWATVAAFVPCAIGIIIYLVVRADAGMACVGCGKQIRQDYKVCPYCGHNQELLCPQCRSPVVIEWKVCPQCGHKLTQVDSASAKP